MTKEKILRAIGTDAWDKIKKLAFGDKPAGDATEATLTDGTTISYIGELAVGTPVMVIGTEGEMPIPDGDYELEDGTTFTTKKGLVEVLTPADEAAAGKEPAGKEGAKNPADLKEKIETMRRQYQRSQTDVAAIKKQFSAMQAENKELRQTLTKITRVLEVLVENTPDEPVRNRQFARNVPAISKAERIAALLKN